MIGRSRAEKKVSALLRAQLSLKHAFERIDYAEDVIKPQLAAIREAELTGRVTVEIERGDVEAVVTVENPD